MHLIRHSLGFASWKDRKTIMRSIKAIYRAADAEAGRKAVEAFENSPWRRKYAAIGQIWRRQWEQVIPFFAFAPAVRKIIHSTAEMDKRFLRRRAIFGSREQPRDEARRIGCKRRQASYSFLAGLRRSRAWPFGERVFQRSIKRA